MTETTDIVMNAWRDRSTRRVKEYSELQEIMGNPILKVAHGGETFIANTGDMIRSNCFRGNAPAVKITMRHKDNGYCRYYAGGLWHRNCDILEVMP
jgi:hypothetical protein